MKSELNSSREDYLEAILMVQRKKGTCYSIDVASQMGYSKPSISNAMKKLQADGYINKASDGIITLTESGMETALKMLERHMMFIEMLTAIGVSRETAEQDACAIEHCLSDESFGKIKENYARVKAIINKENG